MKINCIKVGQLQCNCYLLEQNKECLLIDPGADDFKIKQQLKGKNLRSILITHHHFDHVGCVEKLKEEFQIPVYDNKNLQEGEQKIGIFEFQVISTKGHSKDSLTFYFKSCVKLYD